VRPAAALARLGGPPDAALGTGRRPVPLGHRHLPAPARQDDEHGSPVDYQRRRDLIPAGAISEDQWLQACGRARARPGKGDRRRRDAGRYVYELLTGADFTDPRQGITLPGRDPGDIDLDAVSRLVVTGGTPPGTAAAQLGTTISHVRLALEKVPRPAREWAPSTPPAAWPAGPKASTAGQT
jgi:hypothetical protein